MPKAISSLSARPYLLFIAAFITTALLVGTNQSFSASSLKLISPNGGQSYAVGQSVNIKWAKGNGGSQVKVSLLKGGKGYLVISKKTKNDGKLTWKVSSKLKDGSNYKIKIQSLSDTKVSDTSNKPFKITKAKNTKKATFKVTQPNGRKAYKTGKNMAIRWNKGSGTYVKITLLKGTKTHKVIHKKTKNDGKHNYTIPSTIKAAKNYKVKICSTTSTKSCATSKAFRISKGTATTVKVTYPNGGEKLTQGTTYTIKWDKGNAGNKVKIQLFRFIKGKHKVKYTISKSTKNKGKYSWKVPTKDKGKAFYAGDDLKIKVMAIGRAGKTINDLSDKVFSIVKASGGGSKGGGSTGGGSTGGGATGGGRDEDATVDDPTGPVAGDDGGDAGNQGGGRDGGGQANDQPVPKVLIRSVYTIGAGGLLRYGQDVQLGFSIEDGAGYDFCFLWCVSGRGVRCGETTATIGPFPSADGATHERVATLPATGDYNRFQTFLYGYPTGPSSCSDGYGQRGDLFVITPRKVVAVVDDTPPPAVCGNGVVDDGEACDYEGYQCVGQSHTTTIFRDRHGAQITRYFGGMSCENCAETVENTVYTFVPYARYGTSAYYLDTQSAGDFRCAHLSFCAAGQTPVEAGYRTCSLPE